MRFFDQTVLSTLSKKEQQNERFGYEKRKAFAPTPKRKTENTPVKRNFHPEAATVIKKMKAAAEPNLSPTGTVFLHN